MNLRELRKKRAQLIAQGRSILDGATKETRALTQEENTQYDDLLKQIKELDETIERLERQMELESSLQPPVGGSNTPRSQAPSFNRIPLGDSEERAFAHYFRTGDSGGVRELREDGGVDDRGQPVTEYRVNVPTSMQTRMGMGFERRATDEIMNVAAAADGQAAVPTGFAGRIAARRNGIRLSDRLGVQLVPGTGTTVNFPYENADPVVFAATSEQVDGLTNTYERDRPTLATKAFTLAKKTKKLVLTEELLDDEDANLMGFIADHIGRAIGLTHNSLLLTEVAASGTALKTFASATVIAAGEPEGLVFHSTAAYYLDDGGSIAWVMLPAVYGEVVALLDATPRAYFSALGAKGTLLGYPVHYSASSGATAASTKSVYFGNWFYVGMREDPALRLIRDPYSTDGVVNLKYSFRTCYGVLIAGAIGYGVHPSA